VPTIHIQLSRDGQLPTGQRVQIPGAQALIQRGPIINVSIGLERSMAMSLLSSGAKVPAPIVGLALIDTGASVTCIDNSKAIDMGLPVVDTMKMTSASHDAIEQSAYPISIEIVGTPIQFGLPKAMGANLTSQGLLALIGRDVLQLFTMFYNGPTGQITLSI
jgi:predicted aspartyl protease